MRFTFNSLSMQFLKVHFHYFFPFFQIGIICRHFFHRNIIEFFSHVPFLVEIMFLFHLTIPFFNNFSRVLLKQEWKYIETRDCFAKIFFNFLFENWFNYFEPTIQLKTFTKVKITYLTFLSLCKKWVCKMKCKGQSNAKKSVIPITNKYICWCLNATKFNKKNIELGTQKEKFIKINEIKTLTSKKNNTKLQA